MLNKKSIQVVEHQTLRVGETIHDAVFTQRHYEALRAMAAQHKARYFSAQDNCIRFTQYVGAVQAGDLTIEILPKTDHPHTGDVQRILMDLLRACRLFSIAPESLAQLASRPGQLPDLYIANFFDAVETLLREGLAKTYQAVPALRRALKGRLQLAKHLAHQRQHAGHFYTESSEFNYDHPLNRLLRAALKALQRAPLPPNLEGRRRELLRRFPDVPAIAPAPEELPLGRNALRYATATRMAQWIVQHTQPNVRAGELPALAILFDMNRLFETFIFQQLQAAAGALARVEWQVRRPFWEGRHLQPDIVLHLQGQRIVLDAKWKRLQRVSPQMDDLRQMLAYNQYFQAARSVLVYPAMPGLTDLPPRPFKPTSGRQEPFYCEVRFVALVRDGRLNTHLGKDLLERLIAAAAEVENPSTL
ncbi:MAG TPA: hypothetical protein PKC76_02745 [Saprospiraceae bacterium]|nr:hypothetical protein [Saprospiraceae bacterium]HMP23019.1 hypothetical protein [Saprospiraceae bacterium]